jgi:hypothetical protein
MPVKFGQLAGAGAGVEALHVALLAHFERGVDEDLDELAVGNSARAMRARRGRAR